MNLEHPMTVWGVRTHDAIFTSIYPGPEIPGVAGCGGAGIPRAGLKQMDFPSGDTSHNSRARDRTPNAASGSSEAHPMTCSSKIEIRGVLDSSVRRPSVVCGSLFKRDLRVAILCLGISQMDDLAG